MTLRLIIRTDELRVAGAARATHFRTIDIDLPEVERLLRDGGYNEDGTFLVRDLIGAEVVPDLVSRSQETKNGM